MKNQTPHNHDHSSEAKNTTSRLLNASQYDKVFSNPSVKLGNKFILLLARTNSLPYARLGLVVAKKKIPFAVNRNRYKRLAREHFYRNKENIKGLDIILLARSDISILTTKEQNAVFFQTFEKLQNESS